MKNKSSIKIPGRLLIMLCLQTGIFAWGVLAKAQHKNPECIIDISKPGAAVALICRGQQVEEFNHQIQGGLYAQLITNPSFEEVDKGFKNTPEANWYLVKTGSSDGNLYGQSSKETPMLNNHQEHCIKLKITSAASGPVGLANGGYRGIKVDNGVKYKVSFWARKDNNFKGKLTVKLEGNDGTVYASSAELKLSAEWKHFTCELTPDGVKNVSGDNRFVIYASKTGDVYFDVVTLMPPTWKNRSNGLRPDLAEKMDALKFKYIQFPGGCTAESSSIDTTWTWKNSTGPLEQRPGSTRHRWGYKNDLFFGLDEYFQMCEDMGAEPIYVTSAGISGDAWWAKEFEGICPVDKMQPFIDDVMDLLEYCNGSASTEWGKLRVANGHPAPYNLKYLEIGNENGGAAYNVRYNMIRDAVLAKYPEIKIMRNSHISNRPLYQEINNADFLDEHYYRKDLSELYNTYDSVSIGSKKICVAEYASSKNGNGGNVIGNLGDALADGVFMLGCEKNSEKIWWTGYGNYGGYLDFSNFGPCIVWNDAVSSFATPSYYMQKMFFTDNPGTMILPFSQNTANCYWSVSLDTETGRNDILIKVVNNKSVAETVNIILSNSGKVNPAGKSISLTGAPDDENSIAEPAKITPSPGIFKASENFDYTFPAYSATVL